MTADKVPDLLARLGAAVERARQRRKTELPKHRDPIEDQHGRWLLRIHDDQLIAEGHTVAADNRVELTHDGVVVREFLYPSYRIWTLLAHWKDDLAPDAEAPEPVVETVECTYCDEPIVPEREDGETAFDCQACLNGWHHYDCAHNCSAYLDDKRDEYNAEVWADIRADR